MKTLTKLFIGLTTLVGVVSPITAMTSCSKSPDQPTENVRFDVNRSEMTSSTIGTIVLDWTPNDHSLEFSSANFKYESGTKSAQVSPAAESRPQTFNLTFTSALTDNITDGKLSFHCKDKTLQREYDTSVDNIRLDKYQATILTGGSTSLSGTESTAGIDTKAWALKKGETIISSTMEIVGNNVPAWITISNTEGSDNYHKVAWDDRAQAGSYTFKVKATPINSNASVESSDITLTIDSTTPYIDGLPVKDPVIAVLCGEQTEPRQYFFANDSYDTNPIKLMQGSTEITPDSVEISAKDVKNNDITTGFTYSSTTQKIHLKNGYSESGLIYTGWGVREDVVDIYNNKVNNLGQCTCTIIFTKDGVVTRGSFKFTFKNVE